MKRTLRLAAVGSVAASALAFAANAFATPTLAITQATSSLTVNVTQTQNDPQPAQLRIYVPTGYTLNLSQPVGSTIGHATAQIFSRDIGIPLPLEGDVKVGQLVEPQPAATACTGGRADARWDLALTVAGQNVTIIVFVTKTTGDETTLGSARLDVCLAPDDVPMSNPNRSPGGAHLLTAQFTVNGVFTPPAGAARWTSFWTPYAPGTGVPNPTGAVEARSVVGPGAVTLRAKIVNRKKKIVRLSGVVTQSGAGVGGAKISLLINSRSRFSTKSNASGGFAFRLQNTNRRVTTTFFQAIATAVASDITSTGCANPTKPAVPCVSATSGPFTVRSKKIKVRV